MLPDRMRAYISGRDGFKDNYRVGFLVGKSFGTARRRVGTMVPWPYGGLPANRRRPAGMAVKKPEAILNRYDARAASVVRATAANRSRSADTVWLRRWA